MRFRSPLLIGRDRESALLTAHLHDVRQGRGGAVFLIGDAGIGKSRLVADCTLQALDDGMVVLRGRGSGSSRGVSYKPLREALFSFARTHGPPDDPMLDAYLPALTTLLPEWRSTAGPEHLESLIVLSEAVLRLLIAIGRDRGVVLVLEDLHDADAQTLAVVEYLADNLGDLPIMLLANLRGHSSQAQRVADDCARRRAATLIGLEPLTGADLGALAAACLGCDPGELPPRLLRHLERTADGNPFVVEELLSAMAGNGALELETGRWQLTSDPATQVPVTLIESIAVRAEQIGPAGQRILHAAAIFGRRFPVAPLQAIVGLSDRDMLAFLRAGVAAQLIKADEAESGWYTFRHTLTAEALLGNLIPTERTMIARRAVAAVTALQPGLPGEWCQVVAALHVVAGEQSEAGRLLADAGMRLLEIGAAGAAISLLENAYERLRDDLPEVRAEVLVSLLHALSEGGQAARAVALADEVSELDCSGVPSACRIALRVKAAWVAAELGRFDEGMTHVAAGRELLEAHWDEAPAAALDVVEARLLTRLCDRQPERLARRAAQTAARLPLPEVACQAWELLAHLVRPRGLAEADRYLAKVLAAAEEHGLGLWRIRALFRLAVNASLRDGDTSQVEHAIRQAVTAGAVTTVYTAQATLAMLHAMRGDFAEAEALSASWAETSIRLSHADYTHYMLLAQATSAAHQGRRREMDEALAAFRRWGGEDSDYVALSHGLCQAVCALLEEDRKAAADSLGRAREWEDGRPGFYSLSGRFGLALLLDALADRTDAAECAEIGASPAGMLRWNRHFVLLAEAVALGRSGRGEEARARVEEARETAKPYRMATNLGLRLVAEAALADGWGDAPTWLRTAEEYFYEAGVPAVAGACRTLLRQAGVGAAHRRSGHERIPEELRRLGVTVREHEVFALLAERRGNVEIAKLLFISPRTVEKHVASLLLKTGCTDRAGLCNLAAELPR
ncbi:ATP-binding protein [Nonomuraea soli]|uniref:DNA-binding CsgD family transcriptional regulator n=1 Tax=Nonomuraea soli TaxID=1032476 RepID=A0A7W0CJZ6_9ACTN|nr:LuxR family transcriptional regulator [Nonomuraea soli]MBA2892325.1 DNA-binding CsgD family transcriptional regulator [Nonomuraea soli]